MSLEIFDYKIASFLILSVGVLLYFGKARMSTLQYFPWHHCLSGTVMHLYLDELTVKYILSDSALLQTLVLYFFLTKRCVSKTKIQHYFNKGTFIMNGRGYLNSRLC